jgi:chaperonin cofactor prefoldin
MTTQALLKKIDKIEHELHELKKPKSILGKIQVDSKILKQVKNAIFDFDIERFVSKKDLKTWK